jgi:hypothetical protein
MNTRVVEAVFAEPDEEEKRILNPPKSLPNSAGGVEWEPFGNPRLLSLARNQYKLLI